MKMWCASCGYSQDVSTELFVKIIGGAMPVGGFWAWVTYFFAGTGFALPICMAMVTGGIGILIYKNQIVKWLTNKGYDCPKCGAQKWDLLQDDVKFKS